MGKKKKQNTEEIKDIQTKLENSIDKDIDEANKQSKTYSWIVEFSKRVVSIAFIVFIISTAVEIYMIYMSTLSGDIIGLDTFITETNQTFRIVVGSYCIKAAFENIVKIGGSKYSQIVEIKNKLIEYKLKQNGVDIDISNTTVNDEDDSFDDEDEYDNIEG